MSKSILFIALQCCECSTMQVKQQKKSSNKWVCAVCNQKQSVIKVYAQSYRAKDIRQFVQSFNMSRKVADEKGGLFDEGSSLGHFVEQLEGDVEVREVQETKVAGKRRTDWSEYIEDEQHDGDEPAYLKSVSKEAGLFEPEVVTELPGEGLFKKPKLKGNNEVYKPNFPKRSTYKKTHNLQVETATRKIIEKVKTRPSYSSVEQVWDEHMENESLLHRNTKKAKGVEEYGVLGDARRSWNQEQNQKQQVTAAKQGASKWSEYLAEDEGECIQGESSAFTDDLKLMCRYELEIDGEERVEDDIHPDFM